MLNVESSHEYEKNGLLRRFGRHCTTSLLGSIPGMHPRRVIQVPRNASVLRASDTYRIRYISSEAPYVIS